MLNTSSVLSLMLIFSHLQSYRDQSLLSKCSLHWSSHLANTETFFSSNVLQFKTSLKMICEKNYPTDFCLLIAWILNRIILKPSIFCVYIYKMHSIINALQSNWATRNKHRNTTFLVEMIIEIISEEVQKIWVINSLSNTIPFSS